MLQCHLDHTLAGRRTSIKMESHCYKFIHVILGKKAESQLSVGLLHVSRESHYGF